MGLLTFALSVTLDGCCDHREGVADDEMLRYWARVMDAAGAMLFGRRTYEHAYHCNPSTRYYQCLRLLRIFIIND
jgi:D-serine deaminase-like pyridoxal phosphate-dependent protein